MQQRTKFIVLPAANRAGTAVHVPPRLVPLPPLVSGLCSRSPPVDNLQGKQGKGRTRAGCLGGGSGWPGSRTWSGSIFQVSDPGAFPSPLGFQRQFRSSSWIRGSLPYPPLQAEDKGESAEEEELEAGEEDDSDADVDGSMDTAEMDKRLSSKAAEPRRRSARARRGAAAAVIDLSTESDSGYSSEEIEAAGRGAEGGTGRGGGAGTASGPARKGGAGGRGKARACARPFLDLPARSVALQSVGLCCRAHLVDHPLLAKRGAPA